MTIAWTVLFAAGGLVLFHFLVYPAIVIVAARLARPGSTPAPDHGALPRVSLVIAAYNEERVLVAKLENVLELDYPADRLEIIVVSDGSDDATHEIACAHADRGVVAMHRPERRGKSAALNRAIAEASGDVIVMSDANNDFSRDALRMLVRHFVDPGVGGACGRKDIRDAEDRESSQGDGLYWRYESAIKKAESDLGIMTTADGEIFAVRRELWQPIPPAVINDDAEVTFALVAGGYRIVYEPRAVSTELASSRLEDDFRVKVRMIAGGFQTVRLHWRRLLPPRDRFAWAFLSHKLLRWLMPLLLAAIFGASVAMVGRPIGAALVAGQLAFYGVALLGWVTRGGGSLPSWKYVPLYFTLMNIAAFVGLRRFLAGTGVTTVWQKAAR